jgi:hypothetical protein
MGNNPISQIDPNGGQSYNPIFSSSGRFRGTTKEGYTGEPIIYDGIILGAESSASDFIATHIGSDYYDNVRGNISSAAKEAIWNHIIYQKEGEMIYDEVFSMSKITGGKVTFDGSKKGSWVTDMKKGTIVGSDRYSYTTTVENIQSSIIVHEWYSHKMKKNCDDSHSHTLAYKNVINFKELWNSTTTDYKTFNLDKLQKYTLEEQSLNRVPILYRNLYKTYVSNLGIQPWRVVMNGRVKTIVK